MKANYAGMTVDQVRELVMKFRARGLLSTPEDRGEQVRILVGSLRNLPDEPDEPNDLPATESTNANNT